MWTKKIIAGLGLCLVSSAALALMYTPGNQAGQRTLITTDSSLQNQGFRQLTRPDYSEGDVNYIYALAKDGLGDFISVLENSADQGQLKVKIARIDDSSLQQQGVVSKATQIIFYKNQNAVILRDGGGCGATANGSLHFVSRGHAKSNKPLGAQLQLRAIKLANDTIAKPTTSIAALQGFNFSKGQFQGQNLFLIGTDCAQQAVLVAITGLEISEDNDSAITYKDVIIQRHAMLTKPSAIAVGNNNVYVANHSSPAALLRFVNNGKLDFGDAITESIAQPQSLLLLSDDTIDNIYISSANLQPDGSGAGMLQLQKRASSQKMRAFKALPNGADNRADIGAISDFYRFGNLLIALSAQESRMAIMRIHDNNTLFAITENDQANGINLSTPPSVSGADPLQLADSVDAPSTVMVAADGKYIYSSSDSAATRSILRFSRLADLSLSIERLQKSSQPGKLIYFRILVKNKGNNDIPLPRLDIKASHPILELQGVGKKSCEANPKDQSSYVCEPKETLAANDTFIVTVGMRPRTIGTASIKAGVSSFHQINNPTWQLQASSSLEVGDYHNGALASSPFAFFSLGVLLFARRRRSLFN